ncbi:hypothetical protein ABBQ32_003612 [Trebouxia sp. C0010 RCD-2024]
MQACDLARFARLHGLSSTPENAVVPGRLTGTLSLDRDRTLSMPEAGRMVTQSACSFSLYSYTRQQRWSSPPKTASLLRNKVQALWLRTETKARVRTGSLRCRLAADKPDDTPPASPDISMLSPALQEQWQDEGNMHLSAIKIKPQSQIKAVWQCDKCPAGQPHVWTARVAGRPPSAPCPYCSNNRVCLHNSLATVAPGVAQYWNYSRNMNTPEQVLAGSRSRAEWKCPSCKYEWTAPVAIRTRRKAGCPKCSSKSSKKQSHPTFAEAQPSELAEWDHEQNEADGFYPHEVTLGSCKQVHWICSCCPRGQPHRWTAFPRNRMSYGEGCACCAGQKACACNSLESFFPFLAAEFDVDKNGFLPSEVTVGSDKQVWWRNAKRGSWRQAVRSRTYKRNQWHKQADV